LFYPRLRSLIALRIEVALRAGARIE